LTLFADKERALELPCLPGREAPTSDQFDDLIRQLPLFLRKGRRMRVGVQTGADIRVDPRRVRELVSELVQLAHLLEQCLELHIVDGHDRWNVTSLDQSLAYAPMLAQRRAREGGSLAGRGHGF
jgi:hypothetical protein